LWFLWWVRVEFFYFIYIYTHNYTHFEREREREFGLYGYVVFGCRIDSYKFLQQLK